MTMDVTNEWTGVEVHDPSFTSSNSSSSSSSSSASPFFVAGTLNDPGAGVGEAVLAAFVRIHLGPWVRSVLAGEGESVRVAGSRGEVVLLPRLLLRVPPAGLAFRADPTTKEGDGGRVAVVVVVAEWERVEEGVVRVREVFRTRWVGGGEREEARGGPVGTERRGERRRMGVGLLEEGSSSMSSSSSSSSVSLLDASPVFFSSSFFALSSPLPFSATGALLITAVPPCPLM
jgi:hypothetical protein